MATSRPRQLTKPITIQCLLVTVTVLGQWDTKKVSLKAIFTVPHYMRGAMILKHLFSTQVPGRQCPNQAKIFAQEIYRASHVLEDLGWVELDL